MKNEAVKTEIRQDKTQWKDFPVLLIPRLKHAILTRKMTHISQHSSKCSNSLPETVLPGHLVRSGNVWPNGVTIGTLEFFAEYGARLVPQ